MKSTLYLFLTLIVFTSLFTLLAVIASEEVVGDNHDGAANRPADPSAVTTPNTRAKVSDGNPTTQVASGSYTTILGMGEAGKVKVVGGQAPRNPRDRSSSPDGSLTNLENLPPDKIDRTVVLDTNGNIAMVKDTVRVNKKTILLQEMYVGTITVDGESTYVREIKDYRSEDGELRSTTFTRLQVDPVTGVPLKNAEGHPSTEGESVSVDAFGEVISGNPDSNPALKRAVDQYQYNRVYSAFDKGTGWASISSLFCSGSCFSEWEAQVDKIFHDMYLGSDYWSEAVCRVASSIDSQANAIFSANSDGLLFQSAGITATRQTISTPEGTEYLYTVSYFFRNPDRKEGRSSSKSSSSGTLVRGAGTSTQSSGQTLDREEREVWNEVVREGRTISAELTRNSPTSSGNDIDYNLVFSGDRRIELFTSNQEVSSGDEVFATKDKSIAAFSIFKYNRVCLSFPDEKPVDAFYRDISEICTSIKEIDTTPTEILIQQKQQAQAKGGMNVI